MDVQRFDMSGTSLAEYDAYAMVRTVTQTQTYEDRPLVFLGAEKDECGSDNLTLGGVRFPKLDPDVPKGIDVSLSRGDHWWNKGNYLHWQCDGTAEQTGPNQATEYVIVSRRGGVGDRDIHWYTFNSTFRILRCMAEGIRKSLQEGGRDLYGLRAGPGHG